MADMVRMTREAWVVAGRALFGEDMRTWRFRCVGCGNVQSHESVKQRNPKVGDTSRWINFSCEGRHTAGVGCDWTLGGLFQIHRLEVVEGDVTHRSFEFDDPAVPNESAERWAKAQAEKAKDRCYEVAILDWGDEGCVMSMSAKSRSSARYQAWLRLSDVSPDITYAEFQKMKVSIRQRKQPRLTAKELAESAARSFNASVPVGTPCLFWPGVREGDGIRSRTRSTAWEVCGTPVVLVDGRAGGIALTHVEVVSK